MRRNQRNKKNIIKHKQEKKQYKTSLQFLIFIIISFVICLCGFLFYDFFVSKFIDTNTYEQVDGSVSSTTGTDTSTDQSAQDTTFTLTAIGDVLCHNTQYMDAYNSTTGEYDFSYVYEDIKFYTRTGDLTIGNLETSFAGADVGYSNYPTFNSPDSLAMSLKNIGVDIITTAGNHALDKGFSGLSRTIDVLDQADISHLGTYKTQEERDTVFIKYVKGLKVAFIDYTYGTNGISVPSDKPYCINLIDKDLIAKDIESAKAQNPDVLIACMHWGTEYRTTANSEQEELADFLFTKGVNVIIGNHPHVLEQMEKKTVTLEDGTTQEGFVIYALGNFTADQNYENTRNSIILNLDITKHTDGSVTIDKANYTPIYMYKNTTLSTHKFKLLDIEKTLEAYNLGIDTNNLGSTNASYLTTQLEKIKSIVGPEF